MAANPKTLAKEALRWLTIIAAGGYGLWQLADAARRVIRMQWTGDATDALAVVFVSMIPLLMAAPFLAVAYFCLRRQYRKLFLVLGVVGGVAVFFGLHALPRQLGAFEFLKRHAHDDRGLGMLGLPLCLLMFFGPIYGAAWFYRLCDRLAYPGTPKRPKTQATHWLIWLGVLFSFAPMTIGLFTFTRAITEARPIESLDCQLHWTIALTLTGCLLIFLGLVRRQPIPETPANAASSATDAA
jgi:hypothetical protein